jgi:UPF0716 protein FxsA
MFLRGLFRGLLQYLPLIVLSLPVAELLLDLALYRRYGNAFLMWLGAGAVAGIWLLLRAKESFRAALRGIGGGAAGGDTRALSGSLWSLLAGARAFFAGLLLLFPGVLSDALALLIVLLPGQVLTPPAMRAADAANDAVIEGEFREVKDDTPRLH